MNEYFILQCKYIIPYPLKRDKIYNLTNFMTFPRVIYATKNKQSVYFESKLETTQMLTLISHENYTKILIYIYFISLKGKDAAV